MSATSPATGGGALTAIGGAPGGAGTPAGWQLVLRYDNDVLDVFTQSASHRLHAVFIEAVEVSPHPGPSGWQFVVRATAQGIAVPTSFDAEQTANVHAIIAAVAASRARLIGAARHG